MFVERVCCMHGNACIPYGVYIVAQYGESDHNYIGKVCFSSWIVLTQGACCWLLVGQLGMKNGGNLSNGLNF